MPQRELRSNISAVLGAAEIGATYTVTVDGRPVAQPGRGAERHRQDGGSVIDPEVVSRTSPGLG